MIDKSKPPGKKYCVRCGVETDNIATIRKKSRKKAERIDEHFIMCSRCATHKINIGHSRKSNKDWNDFEDAQYYPEYHDGTYYKDSNGSIENKKK